MTTIQLTLPDSVAREAQDAGLLTPEAVEAMLRENLRKRRVAELKGAMDKLAAANIPPMTMEEINAEIKAYRAERRRATGS
jgi:hypothetical protein